jgi:preprotein translocase subunit SecG
VPWRLLFLESGGQDPPDFFDTVAVLCCGNSPLYKEGGGSYVPAPMTFASIDWLSVSINLLLVLFVIVCLLMTLLILMQRPKQEGLGAAFGGGVTDQVFGARTTNVLQRGTVYLGSLFFVLSLALAVLVGQQNKQKKIVSETKPAAAAPAEDAAPAGSEDAPEGPKSLADELPVEVLPADGGQAPASSGESLAPTPAPAESVPVPEPAEQEPSQEKPAGS